MKKLLLILFAQIFWASDAYNQTLVKDISIGSESSFNQFSEEIFGIIDDVAIFSIITETDSVQIWRSDGTESGTFILTEQLFNGDFLPSIVNDNTLLIGINKDTTSSIIRIDDNAIDITEATFIDGVIKDFNYLNEAVYLAKGEDINFYRELLKYDLSNNTITIVESFGVSGIRDMVTNSDELALIGAIDDTTSLYSYNDINNTFTKIKKLHTGIDFSKSILMTFTEDLLYFFYSFSNTPYTLWSSDGTESGTGIIFDSLFLGPGDNEIAFSKLRQNISFDGKLFFNGVLINSDPSLFDNHLFVSNGDINSTAEYLIDNQNLSIPRYFTTYKNELYFKAGLPNLATSNIFKYNPASEQIEQAINSAPINGIPILGGDYLTVFQEKLFFAGFIGDSSINQTLHSTEGTTETTFLISNPTLDSQPLNPTDLTAGENKLFFFAETEEHGNELWVYEPDSIISSTNNLIIEDLFDLFPNPTNDYLTIKSQNQDNYKIDIYNSLGRRVISRIATNNTQQINLTNLPAGIYSIKLYTNNAYQVKQFVKMNKD